MPKGSPKQLTPEQKEKQEAYEAWFKIVVKILRWKDGAATFGGSPSLEKVTKKEWQMYCETMIKKNITQGEKNTKEALSKTKETITYYNGFAN